jgi:hypothetical protein
MTTSKVIASPRVGAIAPPEDRHREAISAGLGGNSS